MKREEVIKALNCFSGSGDDYPDCPCSFRDAENSCERNVARKAQELLKEQDELLKHEYWRGYNNGRADERGLQEGTIMQTFSPD